MSWSEGLVYVATSTQEDVSWLIAMTTGDVTYPRFTDKVIKKHFQKKLANISLDKKKLKIPSIGWHNLILAKNTSALKNENFFDNFKKEDSFYFVHSYYANPSEKNCILASYKFGGHLIPSIVAKDNIIGCQFHPEKSGPSGLNIIRNFISI